jgi:hypothetical protein
MRTKRQQLDLSTFDGQLLDGLDFCRKVYDLFDQVRDGPDGIAKLRLRPTKNEKRLIEELIPIARYVQARYREGRRIKVRWFSGSQPYDAILWSSGALVEHRMAPRRFLIEVTTSVHQNEYLARRLLHERGGSFGVKGISRDEGNWRRRFEASVLPLRVASRVGRSGNSIRLECFFFQNLFLVGLALDQAARLISGHFLQ